MKESDSSRDDSVGRISSLFSSSHYKSAAGIAQSM